MRSHRRVSACRDAVRDGEREDHPVSRDGIKGLSSTPDIVIFKRFAKDGTGAEAPDVQVRRVRSAAALGRRFPGRGVQGVRQGREADQRGRDMRTAERKQDERHPSRGRRDIDQGSVFPSARKLGTRSGTGILGRREGERYRFRATGGLCVAGTGRFVVHAPCKSFTAAKGQEQSSSRSVDRSRGEPSRPTAR
jgi:hypothetical protein